MPLLLPKVGDEYQILASGWSHAIGSIVAVTRIENGRIWMSHPTLVELWISASYFNTENLKPVPTPEEIEETRLGLEKLLGLKP